MVVEQWSAPSQAVCWLAVYPPTQAEANAKWLIADKHSELSIHAAAAQRAHLVIIGQLLPALNAALGVDDDVLLALNLHNSGHAVWVAAVVDEASHPSLQVIKE